MAVERSPSYRLDHQFDLHTISKMSFCLLINTGLFLRPLALKGYPNIGLADEGWEQTPTASCLLAAFSSTTK